jgi:hypothetical protein
LATLLQDPTYLRLGTKSSILTAHSL